VSYSITISGHVDGAKGEAAALLAAADFAEKIEANGSFAFVGQHLSVAYGPATDAVARARETVEDYNAGADEDDQVALDAPAAETAEEDKP
jgi:hypothetical protein